jgi:hypothetical protein
MKSLRVALAVAAVALVAACSDGSAKAGAVTALTEPQVRAFVDHIEQVTLTDANAQVTGDALADDARITWAMTGTDPEVMDKATYMDEYVTATADVEDEAYSHSIGAIQVAGDGKSATAEVETKYAYTLDGARNEEATSVKYAIELRDGEPLIVAVDANTHGLTIDGKQQF